ncbi:Cation/H(+) antiporter 15 [Rhynchospora pubera]|uniref:Cation/H(+) antiporter 15 n=2 Tax=Rhynchospora pubera TaxID=906938 RepID=A0AAV8DKG4_9POAL|nr:Cation/H(+) antiporter 15 [Rhynchospora pubera]
MEIDAMMHLRIHELLSKNMTKAVVHVASSNNTAGVICSSRMLVTTNGIWKGTNPLDYSLPLFILQMTIIVVMTRVLVVLLKPFRQPRVIAEIMAGVILGPSVMGRSKAFGDMVFPTRSFMTLETVAHLGLLYFLFLVGVEMDVAVIRRSGKKALVIAAAGMALPFCIGTATSFVFRHQISTNVHQAAFLLFLGVALSVTAFPVLARILAETKLLNSDIGRIAMSAAIINDMCAWILLALAIAIAEVEGSAFSSLYVLLSGVAFVLVCFFVVRPIMWWLMRRTPEGQSISDGHICLILAGVMFAGVVTDAIGIHSVFGAFVYGLVIPNGAVGITLVERLEDFVMMLLLPLFFAISGLRTNVAEMKDILTVCLLVLVFVLASIGKIVGTILIASVYNTPLNEGLALGFLMNTRGLIEMIVLNIGRDKQVLDDQSFATMVLVSVLMTTLVTPVVTTLHRGSRRLVGYKRRNLQLSNPDSELRMLACVNTPRNVPSIISLLGIANPTKRSPIFVYALHLVELTGRASNMLILHSAANSTRTSNKSNTSSSPHIFSAFESYEQHAGGVSVQPLTTVSPYSTMHEDVCVLAEDKHVSLIVIPFHKQQTVDGGMEPINTSLKAVNESILNNAPCSVAVFVDRGLSASTVRLATSRRVMLLFFGGPDDREALAFSLRMIDNPSISLTVVRILPLEEHQSGTSSSSVVHNYPMANANSVEGQQLIQDEECLHQFRLRTVGRDYVHYIEKFVRNSEEAISTIRDLDSRHELFIVGRSYKNPSTDLTAGLKDWTDCPELGPIGDILVSSDFSMVVSVLVIQQYMPEGPQPALMTTARHGMESPMNNNQPVQQYVNNANVRMSDSTSSPTAPFNVGWN